MFPSLPVPHFFELASLPPQGQSARDNIADLRDAAESVVERMSEAQGIPFEVENESRPSFWSQFPRREERVCVCLFVFVCVNLNMPCSPSI